MDCHKRAAALYFEKHDFKEWARMQYNLANAWCEVSDQDFPDKWEYAIRHYKQALLFRERDTAPGEYAATLQNLGTAYRQRIRGKKAYNIKKAIDCYRRALHFWTADAHPAHWAALQNNLGNAYFSLPFANKKMACLRARQAICHFDLALSVRTQDADALAYGITRLNRGQACLRLGKTGRSSWLEASLDCLRDARAAFLRSEKDQSQDLIQVADNFIQLTSDELRAQWCDSSLTVHSDLDTPALPTA
jgi:tetratricopeptide (TPR) repeat protein